MENSFKKASYIACLLCFFSIFSMNTGICANKSFMMNENFFKQVSSNSDIEEITKLEDSVLNLRYLNDPIEKRLDRLELEVFGETSSNLSYNERIQKLNSSLNLSYKIQKAIPKEAVNKSNKLTQDSSVSYPMVDTLESMVFNKSFVKDDIYDRVSRLEEEIFKSKNENQALSDRIDALKGKILTTNDDYHLRKMAQENETRYLDNPNKVPGYYGREIKNPYSTNTGNPSISSLENSILRATYPNDITENRLDRLEQKVFKRTFMTDTQDQRIERLMAVNNAKSNSSLMDNDKFLKGTSAAIQIGGILLMILAIIL